MSYKNKIVGFLIIATVFSSLYGCKQKESNSSKGGNKQEVVSNSSTKKEETAVVVDTSKTTENKDEKEKETIDKTNSSKESSDKEAKEKLEADKAANAKAIADKAAADKVAADKMAADKAAAEKAKNEKLARGKKYWDERVLADKEAKEPIKVFNTVNYTDAQLEEMKEYLIDYNIKTGKPSGVDEQLSNMLFTETQLGFHYAYTYPNLNVPMFVDAVKSIVFKEVVPDNIKTEFTAKSDPDSTKLKYISHAVNQVNGEIFYFYTRFVNPPGYNTGFNYILAYWDANKKDYRLYYVKIRLA